MDQLSPESLPMPAAQVPQPPGHDYRRAAFARAAEKDIHPKRAAAAFDVTPETMLRYDTATEKKKTSSEVLGELADDLLPKPKGVGEQE